MLIIINDDRFYLNWLTHHRAGYVLDSRGRPSKGKPVLHRATCHAIKAAPRRRLTSGGRIKACSLDAEELFEWARQYTGGEMQPCPECQPDRNRRDQSLAAMAVPASPGAPAQLPLTPLGRRIMGHVLEVAAMRLGGELSEYGVTVGQLAHMLGKSPAQIRTPMMRLAQDGHVSLAAPIDAVSPLAARTIVFPTAAALRSLPAFAGLPDDAMSAELDRLRAQ